VYRRRVGRKTFQFCRWVISRCERLAGREGLGVKYGPSGRCARAGESGTSGSVIERSGRPGESQQAYKRRGGRQPAGRGKLPVSGDRTQVGAIRRGAVRQAITGKGGGEHGVPARQFGSKGEAFFLLVAWTA